MRLAVFSDIHGNYQALKSIINDIKNNNIDKIIFLGDAIAIGPESNKCLDLFRENNIIFILGNHEYYYLKGMNIDPGASCNEIEHHHWVDKTISEENKHYLSNLNNEYTIKLDNKVFKFFHFFKENNIYPFKHLNIFRSEEYINIMNKELSDYVFYGHDHASHYDKINNKEFYGIGSSGCSKDNKTYYYIIDSNDNINIFKKELTYDRELFENIMNNINYPDIDDIKKIFFGL